MIDEKEKEVPQEGIGSRERFGQRMKAKYPDKEFGDDEALFGQINDDYDEYDNRLKESDEKIRGFQDKENRLTELFDKDPRSAQFLTDMARGEDPWIACIDRLGIDGITDLLNDPDKREEYAKANQNYIERLARNKELDEEYEKNFAASMQGWSQYQQEKGLSDEQIDAAGDMIMRIVNDAVLGKLSVETLEMVLNCINRDRDIADAREEGNIAGRNAKIEEKLRKQKSGDGLPHLGGANNVAAPEPKRRPSIFDIAKEAR